MIIDVEPSINNAPRKDNIRIEPNVVIPKSESLKDTADRVLPLWEEDILPRILLGQNVLVVGHANTIRTLVKHLDNLTDTAVREVTIPSAIPLLYSFTTKNIMDEQGSEQGTRGQGSGVVTAGTPSPAGMRGRFIVTKELLELSLLAAQHLEMSENLDEGDAFLELIKSSLNKVTSATAGGTGAGTDTLSSASNIMGDGVSVGTIDHLHEGADPELLGAGRVMESGWMMFPMKHQPSYDEISYVSEQD
jgi:hypothetical protein